jgi:GPH family glycoside/pentoside/hexuronide:cation symporter
LSNNTGRESSPNQLEFKDKVPLKAKFGFGFANAANAIMSLIGLGTIDVFYIKVYGANPSLLAWSWIFFIAWNIINDPLIGIIQDRTKTRWGRRIPYLRFGALPYALSFIIIWFPFMQSELGLFINHLLMIFIFDTFFSMMGLITFGLPAEMAINAKERTKISIFGIAFGAIGMIIRFTLEPVFLAGDNPNKFGFQIAVTIFGIISGLLLFISSYYIKENLYTRKEKAFGFIKSITETLKNKPFLITEVAVFFMVIMTETITNGFIFLFDYVLIFGGYSIIFFIIFIVIVLVLTIWIYKKISQWGLKKVLIVSSLIALAGFILVFIIGLVLNSKVPFEFGSFGISFIILGLLIFNINQGPLIGESIDYDEMRTGKRRETTYAGVNALVTKPAISVAHASILGIMGLFGFIEGEVVSLQPATVSTGVLIAITVVPIVCLIIVIIALSFYPLEGEDWYAKKLHIQQVHLQKEKEYLESVKKKSQ